MLELRLLLLTQLIPEALVLLLHGADFLPQSLVLLPEFGVVGTATLGGLSHLPGLAADAVGRARAGTVLFTLLVVGLDALPLLLASHGSLPLLRLAPVGTLSLLLATLLAAGSGPLGCFVASASTSLGQ